MPIKHLVLGGGGAGGFAVYGALRYLAKNNFWELNQIKSMYSTSIGSLIAVLIIICEDLTILDDYIIKRPWDKVLKIEPDHFFEMYYNKGLFHLNLSHIYQGPQKYIRGGVLLDQQKSFSNTNFTFTVRKRFWMLNFSVSYTIRNIFSETSVIVDASNISPDNSFNYYDAHRQLLTIKMSLGEKGKQI